MLKWLKKRLVRDDPASWRLELHDAGFRCHARKRSDDVRWADLESIRTYKLDVFAYDLICIAFESSSGECVAIHEQMKGFMGVVKQMEQTFPEIPSDWYTTVMLPAFATNERVLWNAANAQGNKTDQ